jgi:hypothetical protein
MIALVLLLLTNTVDVDGTLRKRITTGPHTALTATEEYDAFGRVTKMTTTAFNAGTTTISYSDGKRIIPEGAPKSGHMWAAQNRPTRPRH